jgi:hypothetical protein
MAGPRQACSQLVKEDLARKCRLEEKLARCRQLLGMPANPPPAEESKDYRERYEELTGCSLREYPFCHQGRMVTVAILLPNPERRTLIMDTS